jgi:hypothetical protein
MGKWVVGASGSVTSGSAMGTAAGGCFRVKSRKVLRYGVQETLSQKSAEVGPVLIKWMASRALESAVYMTCLEQRAVLLSKSICTHGVVSPWQPA